FRLMRFKEEQWRSAELLMFAGITGGLSVDTTIEGQASRFRMIAVVRIGESMSQDDGRLITPELLHQFVHKFITGFQRIVARIQETNFCPQDIRCLFRFCPADSLDAFHCHSWLTP